MANCSRCHQHSVQQSPFPETNNVEDDYGFTDQFLEDRWLTFAQMLDAATCYEFELCMTAWTDFQRAQWQSLCRRCWEQPEDEATLKRLTRTAHL